MSSFNALIFFREGRKFWVGQFRSKHKRIAGSGCVMQLLDMNNRKMRKNAYSACLISDMFYSEQIRNLRAFLTIYVQFLLQNT